MKTQAVAVSYCIELEISEFTAIINLDKHLTDTEIANNTNKVSPNLGQQLCQQFPLFNIEYNGHFGPNIFYSIPTQYNNIFIREMIEKYIKSYIKKGLKFEKKGL